MTGKSKPKVQVSVTVEDTHLEKIASVARQLEAAGLGGSQTLASAGIITGHVSAESVAGLRKVAGVRAVESAGTVQIAPPDADIQ